MGALAAWFWWPGEGRVTPADERGPVETISEVSASEVEGAETGTSPPVASALSGVSPSPVVAQQPQTTWRSEPGVDVAEPAGEGHARELERIEAAVVTYAVESLPALAVYLTHADAAVREAARDGFLQMGLTEGAAHLRAAADRVRDPREAVQLLDAADFLDLPTVPVTGGPELKPVSARTREQMERERAAEKTNTRSEETRR